MFVQVIEGQTRDAAAILEQGDRWQRELRPGAIGYLGVTAGVTDDGRSIAIVRFEDEASAVANAQRPEQTAWFEGMAELYDGEPAFTESSDVTEWMGGGSNDAGFVQVMKSHDVDRGQVRALDREFEAVAPTARPDLIGGTRVWTGPHDSVEVAYFTSEAAAREGEQKEMPPEMADRAAEFEAMMKNTEFIDIHQPWLY